MSTWTSPITWTAASVLTAAQMNAEVRDHINYLKGALDLITNGSTADTGTGTNLGVTVALATSGALSVRIMGDSDGRMVVAGDGTIAWGDGAGVFDTNLFRSSAYVMKVLGHLWCPDGITTLSVSGTPTDGDFPTAPNNGAIAIDSSASKLWARIGGVWKGVALT